MNTFRNQFGVLLILVLYHPSVHAGDKKDGAFQNTKSGYSVLFSNPKKSSDGETYYKKVQIVSKNGVKNAVDGLENVSSEPDAWSPDGMYLRIWIWSGDRQSECLILSMENATTIQFKTSAGKVATCDNTLAWVEGKPHTLQVSTRKFKVFQEANP